MGSLNADSIVRKGPLIQELITSHRLDALAICVSFERTIQTRLVWWFWATLRTLYLDKVKSLRITLDGTLSFDNHVDTVCRAAHFPVAALYATYGTASITIPTVACSLVGARLDYCNSLLHGNFNMLQQVISTLSRVVSGTKKRDHITPVLADLYWLTVTSRITLKIALQTFKTITTKKPEYLANLLSFQTAPRSLRSSSKRRLRVDVARTVFSCRAFRHALNLERFSQLI